MGRTLPTIIQSLHAEEDVWKPFRRALRKEDQDAFDLLWRYARRHAAPACMTSRPIPFEAFVMGMLVGLARELQRRAETAKNIDSGEPYRRDNRNSG